jgi:hypothetical protein
VLGVGAFNRNMLRISCHADPKNVVVQARAFACPTILTDTYRMDASYAIIRQAALDQEPISGLTHCYYRYPARFSPAFARAAIQQFSLPGDAVLDPYMGGGTTAVEAMVAGRLAIGTDINSLAVFVARAKTDELTGREERSIARWASETVPALRCNDPMPCLGQASPRNMSLPSVRFLRKTIAQCIDSIEYELPTARSRRLARCAVLNVGQWALNGRKRIPTAAEFRHRVESHHVRVASWR